MAATTSLDEGLLIRITGLYVFSLFVDATGEEHFFADRSLPGVMHHLFESVYHPKHSMHLVLSFDHMYLI